MSNKIHIPSRRDFLKTTGIVAAGATALSAVPRVHAAENNIIQVALVGCGGRGTGAAVDAVSVNQGGLRLVSMADVFEDRLVSSHKRLQTRIADKMDVPLDQMFCGFDAYKNSMDCLKPGDIVILTTPLAFRWVHFEYAIKKGLHVFMEKPLTADGPTSRRMLELNEKAKAKNLKVGVGLKSRHSRHLQQLYERVRDGAIGDIVTMRAYRMTGPVGSAFCGKCPEGISELEWQIRNFHAFLWASGGAVSDFYIHVVDHCCWLKGSWPVKAQSVGGRHYRITKQGEPAVDQNFDSYGVEYTFDDGAKLFLDGRCMMGAENFYSSFLHGTKGSAIASKHGDCGPPSSIYKGQAPDAAMKLWESSAPKDQANPFQNEWNDLMDAIRNDEPFNEVQHGVEASVACNLGRKAAHTAQELTWDEVLNDDREYAPGCDKWQDMNAPAPVQPDADGNYPIPMPGLKKNDEY